MANSDNVAMNIKKLNFYNRKQMCCKLATLQQITTIKIIGYKLMLKLNLIVRKKLKLKDLTTDNEVADCMLIYLEEE